MQSEPIRTKENWTYGIINIPLLYGHNNRHGINPKSIFKGKMHDRAKCYGVPYYVMDKSKRYLWFEIDTHEIRIHEQVLAFFSNSKIDVYYHYTANGIHYITMKVMPVDEYQALIKLMNDKWNSTFAYSLRIVPNKWNNDIPNWYTGAVLFNGSNHRKELQYIQKAINQPYIFNYNKTEPKTVTMLDNMFAISRYPFSKYLEV